MLRIPAFVVAVTVVAALLSGCGVGIVPPPPPQPPPPPPSAGVLQFTAAAFS